MAFQTHTDYQQLVAQKLKANTFTQAIGFQMDSVEPGATAGHLPVSDMHRQQNGFVHGGVLMTLCDIVAGFAAFTLVKEGEHVVTAEIKVNCLRPAAANTLQAKGWVLKAGKNLHFCESEVWYEDAGKFILVAKASTTMAVVRQEGYMRE